LTVADAGANVAGMSESRPLPTFEFEAAELAGAAGPVAGVDEAGRGPWAGPVVAAAVVLDPDRIPDGIDDSKALEPEAREEIYRRILASAKFGVGIAHVARIDRVNILNATLWAMRQAIAALEHRPRVVLIDGNQAPRMRCMTRTIVGGDATCVSIAAASIVAKVTRDRWMVELAQKLPGYGFERHKGYGTPEHQEALTRLGASIQHRRSFRPVKIALGLVAEPDEAG
jgi:ribonuclease HII